jgi:hypothetical protein
MNLEKQRINFNASVGLFESRYLLGKLEGRIALEKKKDSYSYSAETHPASGEIIGVLEFAHNFLEDLLGKDLGHLKPDLKNIFIYTDTEFEVAKDRHDLDSMSKAFSKQVSGEIHLNGSETKYNFFHHLIHEYVHLLSRQRMMIRHGAQKNLVGREVSAASDYQGGLGMNIHRKFIALNEVITEMLTCEVLREIVANSEEQGFEALDPAYKSTLFTLGTFLYELARMEKIPFLELRKIFYGAYIEGDMSVLRLVTKHFGAKTTGEISDFPVLIDESDAARFLHKYDLLSSDIDQRYNDLNVLNLFKMLRA